MLAQPALAVPPPEYRFNFNAGIKSPSTTSTTTAVQPKAVESIQLPSTRRTTSPSAAFSLRPATIQDAPAIADLGSTVFTTTFGFSIPAPDLNAYLDEAYSITAIERDIQNPSTHVIVAVESSSVSNQQIIGFAQLTEGTSEPCIEDLDSIVELQRLYVHQDFHGLGVGKALTAAIEDKAARVLDYRAIWLGVWEGNFKAQRVYEAMGYSRVGEHEFKMGRCIQTDWIMVKDLL
ncbi:hypothetical protein ABEF95_007309 [Exophiala dermatitidis]